MKNLMSKTLFICFVLTFVVNSLAYGQAKNSKEIKKINRTEIAKIGTLSVSYGELERAFKKNMNRKEASLYTVSKDSVDDFLNLYVKYKLKVLDALDRGYDKDSAVIKDIEQNRKILAESYYYDKVLTEPELDKLMKQRKEELLFAYIYFAFPPAPNNNIIEPTMEKARKTLALLKKGADFAQLAKDSSDDKKSAGNGGVTPYYVTAGKTQRPIEQAIYSLKPGEFYPEIIKTKYGCILVKLIDRQPRKRVYVSHILLNEGFQNETKEDSLAMERKADSIVALIKNGVDFNQLAEDNSDDAPTAMKGGNLGAWYSRSTGIEGKGNQLVPEFEKAIYKLKDGEISGKVHTSFGIHIIRRDSTFDFDEEEERAELKRMYKRVYFTEDKKAHLKELSMKYGYNLDEKNFNEFLSKLDTNATNLKKNWDSLVTKKLGSKTLYNFNKKKTTVADFIKEMNSKSELRGLGLNEQGLKECISRLIYPISFELASANLEKDYPDFKALMDEFRDGILLFRVEALEVWDKLKFDSTKAKEYFDNLDKDFYTEPSWDISEIYVLNDSLAKDLYKQLKDGADFAELASTATQRSKFREKKGHWGVINAKEKKIAKIVAEKNITSETLLEPVKFEGGWSIIKVHSYEPVRKKTFEEAISDFAPDFQDMMQKKLTNAWIDNVKKKFPVKINNKALDKAINKMKKLN